MFLRDRIEAATSLHLIFFLCHVEFDLRSPVFKWVLVSSENCFSVLHYSFHFFPSFSLLKFCSIFIFVVRSTINTLQETGPLRHIVFSFPVKLINLHQEILSTNFSNEERVKRKRACSTSSLERFTGTDGSKSGLMIASTCVAWVPADEELVPSNRGTEVKRTEEGDLETYFKESTTEYKGWSTCGALSHTTC